MLATALEPGATERPKSERLRQAVEEFYARSTRLWHPEGEWREGLWYPSAAERRACCTGFEPSPKNRQALESHCRSQAHVAARYGLPALELKAAVRKDRNQGSPIAQHVASSFVGPRPRVEGAEAFAEMRRRAREETFESLRAALADSLSLFEQLQALEHAEGPHESVLAPLLERTTASAERLIASLHFARSLETNLACTKAMLESFKALLEAPRQKRRRASAVPPVIGGE